MPSKLSLINRRHSPAWLLAGVLLMLGTAGCQNSAEEQAQIGVAAYYSGEYLSARALFDPLARQTNGEFVLNNERLGSSTLAAQQVDEAQAAFLRAYEVLNSVGVNNGGRSLGASIVSENLKVFKGEPYERAMCNFYLGVTYYMTHDYGNARACFENALFKLKDYTDADKPDQFTEIASNFALAYVMLGRCYQQLGDADKAASAFSQAVKVRPDLAALCDPAINEQANVLLVIDWGHGPRKMAAGDGSFIGIRPTPQEAGPIYQPVIYVDGAAQATNELSRPSVDLLALAQDRRWQSIDTIRVVKSIVGESAMAVGAYELTRRGRGNQEAGAILLLSGLLLKASSSPDLRHWEMLPRTVFLVPLKLTPGSHDITVEFAGGNRQTWRNVPAPDRGDNTYFFHLSRYGPTVMTWPPPQAPPLPPPSSK